MKLLPDVFLGPRNNPLNFRDDPDYDPDPECLKRLVSRAKKQSNKFGGS